MAVTDRAVLSGRYVLEEVLGAEGMATVWRAADRVLGRQVAVKVLSPQLAADPGFAARFEREARHAARLAHPRLVTVFDCGVDEGLPFIVMELVEGRTLRHILDQAGPLPPDQAVAIAAAVCEGLEVAHAAGLVHRDVKPANITLAGGEVKVLDFGIARADGLSGGTGTRMVLGTAAYLSPEQARGSPVGPQSDLYSLGCVLFEMLTGVPPFAADSAVGLAYQHVHDDPGPPSARRPGSPSSLACPELPAASRTRRHQRSRRRYAPPRARRPGRRHRRRAAAGRVAARSDRPSPALAQGRTSRRRARPALRSAAGARSVWGMQRAVTDRALAGRLEGPTGSDVRVRAMSERKAEALERAARLCGRDDEASRQALSRLWDEAFDEGRLSALDELQDRFCVCMK